jgi:hypothetical protein
VSGGLGAGRPAPVRDLFATAVHRYGSAWADLAVATTVAVAVATAAVAGVSRDGIDLFTASLTYGVAYFAFLGFVLLRGLPAAASRARVVRTYAAAAGTGIVAGLLVVLAGPLAIVPLPLLFFVVPAVAAGDAGVDAVWRGPMLALRAFSRTWAVWLITLVFSIPVIVSAFLVVFSFASAGTSTVVALALSAPIVWPVSALFVRALYGDLTGRIVVAPEDRSEEQLR